jgi:hypothetical protein
MHKHLVALFKQSNKRTLRVNSSQLVFRSIFRTKDLHDIVPNDTLSVVKLFERTIDTHLHVSHMSIHTQAYNQAKHMETSMK